MKKGTKFLLLISLLLITVYSRFLNLNWDQGYGFHPDENNLWGAARRVADKVRRDGLDFKDLDPEFYAYGGFPIYLYSWLPDKVYARAVSATAQTAIVLLLFIIGRQLNRRQPESGSVLAKTGDLAADDGWSGGLITAAIGVFSAGLLQAAHFLTVESLLGLFGLMIIFCLFKSGDRDSSRLKRGGWFLLGAGVLGLGVGTKVSFAVFGLPFLLLGFRERSNLFRLDLSRLDLLKLRTRSILTSFLILTLTLLIAGLIFLITNPFVFGQGEEVRGIIRYEARVATGDQRVFYTRQFTETIPGWFQLTRVFPYIMGWLFVPLWLVGIGVVVRDLVSKDYLWQRARIIFLTATLAAIFSFLPLWAKWTRYGVQVLPVLILGAGVGVAWVGQRGRLGKLLMALSLVSFIIPFFGLLVVYLFPDNRIQAAKWAETEIPTEAKIFTEALDLGILPFNAAHMDRITLFNFYELDEDKTGERQKELDSLIRESEYFISVSRRVYGNSLRYPARFSGSAQFYQSLFDGSLGFLKVYESSGSDCSLFFVFCSLFPDAEETFEVFDHPRIQIFRKSER